jgi:hypothetical protein
MAWKPRGGWIVMGFALAVCAGAMIFALRGLALRGVEGPITTASDFQAFYCAARVAGAHADPYRSEPLRSCETAATLSAGFHLAPNLVVPAPLPGYAFALLDPLARLPFLLASALWFALGAGAVVVTIALMVRLTNLPGVWVGLAVAFSSLGSLLAGQIVPLVVASLCGAAFALRSRRPAFAAVCVAISMLEPHLGLPAAIAMLIWIPQSRLPLLACGAALAALSLAYIGVSANVEYFTAVLPAHAQSEVGWFPGQYGLSALLYRAGSSMTFALDAGWLSYVAMLGLGVRLGRRCALVFNDPACVPLVAAACALLGGPFIHISQMAVANAAALLLYSHEPARRPLLRAALAFLAIPWALIAQTNGTFLSLGLFALRDYSALTAVSDGGRLAEDVWKALLDSANVLTLPATLGLLAVKLPTWAALAIILRAAFLARPSEAIAGEPARGPLPFARPRSFLTNRTEAPRTRA